MPLKASIDVAMSMHSTRKTASVLGFAPMMRRPRARRAKCKTAPNNSPSHRALIPSMVQCRLRANSPMMLIITSEVAKP